jgi:hypothetical protein
MDAWPVIQTHDAGRISHHHNFCSPLRVLAFAGTDGRRPHMTVDVTSVITVIVVLTGLLLVAGAEARWRRQGQRAVADERRPTSGADLVPAVSHQVRRHPVGRQVPGAQDLAHAQRLPRGPGAAWERGIINIATVYRTSPVMVVGETAEGALLEHSLHELADMPWLLAPRLWRELVEQYQVFQIR